MRAPLGSPAWARSPLSCEDAAPFLAAGLLLSRLCRLGSDTTGAAQRFTLGGRRETHTHPDSAGGGGGGGKAREGGDAGSRSRPLGSTFSRAFRTWAPAPREFQTSCERRWGQGKGREIALGRAAHLRKIESLSAHGSYWVERLQIPQCLARGAAPALEIVLCPWWPRPGCVPALSTNP